MVKNNKEFPKRVKMTPVCDDLVSDTESIAESYLSENSQMYSSASVSEFDACDFLDREASVSTNKRKKNNRSIKQKSPCSSLFVDSQASPTSKKTKNDTKSSVLVGVSTTSPDLFGMSQSGSGNELIKPKRKYTRKTPKVENCAGSAKSSDLVSAEIIALSSIDEFVRVKRKYVRKSTKNANCARSFNMDHIGKSSTDMCDSGQTKVKIESSSDTECHIVRSISSKCNAICKIYIKYMKIIRILY
jgi:hypothetical protein